MFSGSGADFGPTSLDIRWEYFDVDAEPGSSCDPSSTQCFSSVVFGVPSDFGGSFEDQLWSLTVTAGWHLTDGLQFRVEYRHDDADEDDEEHRDSLRQAGLRPVQLWVPDTRRPDFAAECRRQAQRVAKADKTDVDTEHFMDEALADLDGWTE